MLQLSELIPSVLDSWHFQHLSGEHYPQSKILGHQFRPGGVLRAVQVLLQPLFLARRPEPIRSRLEDRYVMAIKSQMIYQRAEARLHLL